MFDTDNDGTLDLAEVKKAASDLFARLDRDHDGTLEKRELAGRLSARELAAADPDHDGTLTAEEYLRSSSNASTRQIRIRMEPWMPRN
jgi:Ca2+-binding EF-hand superfamily protein